MNEWKDGGIGRKKRLKAGLNIFVDGEWRWAEAVFNNHLYYQLLASSILPQDQTPRDSLRNRLGPGGSSINGSQNKGHVRFS